jgi:Xaa-Pro aminopeptidase
MNSTVESLPRSPQPGSEPVIDFDPANDRRADVDAKQARIAALLQEVGCEGLLVFDPDNFTWLTSGGGSRGSLDPGQHPALYFSSEQRWLLGSNADSQRLFDEEIDGLGFQLKEWPWHWGRDQLVADLAQGRRLASDRPLGDHKCVGPELARLRRVMTDYEQACFFALGLVVSHALEATCRTMTPGETEREIAGQLSHRLLHRGALPLLLGAAADGRSKFYRQFGFTNTPIRKHCVVLAAARKYGLCAMASRAISFGEPEKSFLEEHNAAAKVCATYIASTWPDAVPREILGTGRRVYLISGYEHEWLQCPQGHVCGRAPVELALTPQTEDLFQPGWAVTWRASVNAATSCDTFLVTDQGPRWVTPTEPWPLKRIRIQGADFFRPDILQR